MLKFLIVSFLFSFNCHAYFKMHKQINKNNFKICIIGDTGTGSKTHYKMATMLAKEQCHQVRVLGDLIYPNGLKNESDLEYYEKFYAPFMPVIKSKNNPLFHIVVGNHDYRKDEYVWIRLHNKFHYLFSPSLNYVETYHQGDICFFNIDTTAAQNFKLSRAYRNYKWLNNQLKGHESCRVKIAFGHHPYKSSGFHSNAFGPLKYFLKHSIIGKVDAYFAGHEHQLSHEGTSKGTHLFISGSFSKSRKLRKRPVFGTNKNGYIVMTIDQSPEEYFINLDFKVLDGDKIKSVYKYQIIK
jgi:tartrate-resistant acid phosphatase type 5